MNKKKNYASGVNVGSSSILVTFVLLCLVTFAALAFVSANSDLRLSTQAADRTTRFYNANHMAEVYLLNIESQVRMAVENSDTKEYFYDNIENIFADNDSVSVVKQDDESIHLLYTVAVSDRQVLDIILCTSYDEFKENDSVSIEKWQTVSTFTEEKSELKDNNINLLFNGED